MHIYIYIYIYVPGFLGPPHPPQRSCSVKKVAQCDRTNPPPPCGMGGGGSMVPTFSGRMVAQCDRKPPHPLWDGWGWGHRR